MRRRIPSRNKPVSALISYVDSLFGPAKDKYGLLKLLGGSSRGFWSMKLIPSLVSLYEWLYDAFGHVLTKDAAESTSMRDLFASLS